MTTDANNNVLTLGINYGMHDSAAALVCRGKIVAAVEEERLTRIKHAPDFPVQSIREVLRLGGVSMDDVTQATFSFRPGAIRSFILKRAAVEGFPSQITYFRSMLNWYRTVWEGTTSGLDRHFNYRGRVVAIDHHLAHAASAFYPSGFDRALILTADGTGDRFTFAVWRGEEGKIRLLYGTEYPDSIGLVYSMITHHVGLGLFGEGKTMGLAAFGQDRYAAFFDDFLQVLPGPDGRLRPHLNRRYLNTPQGYLFMDRALNKAALEHLGPPRRRNAPIEERHQDIARSLQARLERVFLHIVPELMRAEGVEALCMAGGVALNGVVNGLLVSEGAVKRLFIQPAAGDSGTAIGAAFWAEQSRPNPPRPAVMRSAALGPGFERASIEEALAEAGLKADPDVDVVEETARILAEGGVVGWFQGRMEFGPRALGNRSILANPTLPGIDRLLNEQVKFREGFRPFGASVPQEDVARYFTYDGSSPFMLVVTGVQSGIELPGITHVDGSVRIQTVERSIDSRYWALHRAFEARTGVPVLLNTSFNVKGEPIVCSPADAVTCFLNTRLDALAIGDYLVRRPDGLAAPLYPPVQRQPTGRPAPSGRPLQDWLIYGRLAFERMLRRKSEWRMEDVIREEDRSPP